jgi:hypothetical protein
MCQPVRQYRRGDRITTFYRSAECLLLADFVAEVGDDGSWQVGADLLSSRPAPLPGKYV